MTARNLIVDETFDDRAYVSNVFTGRLVQRTPSARDITAGQLSAYS